VYAEGLVGIHQASVIQLNGIKRLAGRRSRNESLIGVRTQTQQIQIQKTSTNGCTVNLYSIVEEADGGEVAEQFQIHKLGRWVADHKAHYAVSNIHGRIVGYCSHKATAVHQCRANVDLGKGTVVVVDAQFRAVNATSEANTQHTTVCSEICIGQRLVSGSRGASETVVITHVTFAVAIRVCLIRIRNHRTVIVDIRNAIAVGVGGITAAAVADIANTIAIGISLIRIGSERAVIGVIGDAITITVVIAHIADTVQILIRLIRIRGVQTVVIRVQNGVTVAVVFAGITDAVSIRIHLIIVRGVYAVVVVVVDAIAIGIIITDITDTIVTNSK
jgi:hypothetical protein